MYHLYMINLRNLLLISLLIIFTYESVHDVTFCDLTSNYFYTRTGTFLKPLRSRPPLPDRLRAMDEREDNDDDEVEDVAEEPVAPTYLPSRTPSRSPAGSFTSPVCPPPSPSTPPLRRTRPWSSFSTSSRRFGAVSRITGSTRATWRSCISIWPT